MSLSGFSIEQNVSLGIVYDNVTSNTLRFISNGCYYYWTSQQIFILKFPYCNSP